MSVSLIQFFIVHMPSPGVWCGVLLVVGVSAWFATLKHQHTRCGLLCFPFDNVQTVNDCTEEDRGIYRVKARVIVLE